MMRLFPLYLFANFFLVVFAVSDSFADQTITLKAIAAADEEFRQFYGADWRSHIQRRIKEASEVFATNFNIRFELTDTVEWVSKEVSPNAINDMNELYEDLEDQILSKSDSIVIGFMKQEPKSTTFIGTLGATRGFGCHILVRDFDLTDDKKVELLRKKVVLVHELARIFGAFSVNDPQSVMSFDSLSLGFDHQNRRVIELTRDKVDCEQGAWAIDAILGKTISDIFNEGHAEKAENPILKAWDHLALDEYNSAHWEAFSELVTRCIVADPKNPLGYYSFAATSYDRGLFDDAIFWCNQVIERDRNYQDVQKF